MKGNLTISKPTNISLGQHISIKISDEKSGMKIVELNLSLEDFAKCITGQAHMKGDLDFVIREEDRKKVGKKKELRTLCCEKQSYSKNEQRMTVLSHFDQWRREMGEEWEIWSDGTTTQQRNSHHEYTVCRYVEVDNE